MNLDHALPVPARHHRQDPHLGHPRRAIRRPGGRRRRRDAQARRPPAPDAVGGGAREPDQPVPVQQGGRGQGRRRSEAVSASSLVLLLATRLRDDRRRRSARSVRAAEPRDLPFNEVVDESHRQAGGARPTASASTTRSAAGSRNFFSNIGDLVHRRQQHPAGQVRRRLRRLGALVFNTTIGLFGIHDVASDMGIEKHNEDFGQTFGRWGARRGTLSRAPAPRLEHRARRRRHSRVDMYVDPLGESCARSACATRCTRCAWSTRAPSCSTRAASSSRRRSTSTCSCAMPTCSAAATWSTTAGRRASPRAARKNRPEEPARNRR